MSNAAIFIIVIVVLALFAICGFVLMYFVTRAFWREGRPTGFRTQGYPGPWYRPSERFQGDPWSRYWKKKFRRPD